MEKLFLEIDQYIKQEAISHLYIKDGKLRATYHLDNIYSSFWKKSDYYNSWMEVVDTSKINELFHLDYRETDITDTLALKWYFLVWESGDFIPEYLKKFFLEFHNYLLSETPKIIKRTRGKRNLIYIPLLLQNSSYISKKCSQAVSDILAKF